MFLPWFVVVSHDDRPLFSSGLRTLLTTHPIWLVMVKLKLQTNSCRCWRSWLKVYFVFLERYCCFYYYRLVRRQFPQQRQRTGWLLTLQPFLLLGLSNFLRTKKIHKVDSNDQVKAEIHSWNLLPITCKGPFQLSFSWILRNKNSMTLLLIYFKHIVHESFSILYKNMMHFVFI